MNFKYYIFFIFFVFFLPGASICNAGDFAQGPGDTLLLHKFSLQSNIEYLHSTHRTDFKGFSVQVNYKIGKNSSLGIGYERTVCSYHPDNNWNLYRLKFAPVYLSQHIQLFHKNTFRFFTETRQGISFIRYDKEEFKTAPGVIYPVKEKGLYFYAGLGAGWNFLKNCELHTAVGFKAYHISSYAEEVNPHGINYQIGLRYSFANASK